MIVENLYAYGHNGKELLHDVSFKAKQGEIIAIVGKSGAGKSTLMRVISGVGIKHKGTITGIKKIGFLYQDSKESLSPAYTILSQVMEYVGDKAGAIKWLDRVRLASHAKSYSDLLSGGQRMRASLAINMHRGADVLLLDEPTANLDDKNKKIVIDILLEDVAKNKTILLWVTHDLKLAKKISNRILVVDNGKVVEDCLTKDFFKKPKSKQGQALLKTTPLVINKNISSESICSVQDLHAGYNNKAIIKNISFEIKSGQTLGVYGNSGVGKTTLLRVLTQQIPPLQGSIKIPKKVQVIFQDACTALNPSLSIFTSVAEPLGRDMHSDCVSNKVNEALKMVGIDTGQSHRLPHSFSGGELVRIGIARAIISNPDLILADEITASLDSINAMRILKTLSKIQNKSGVSFLYISHDKDMLNSISHKVLKIGN